MPRVPLLSFILGILLLASAAFAWPPGGNGGGKPPKDEDPPTEPPPVEPLYEYVGLGNLGAWRVYTNGVNNLNDVVGAANTPENHAFLCTTDANGARLPIFDLNDFLEPDDPLVLTDAKGVNDLGQVAGYGEIGETLLGFLFTPPPGASATMTANGPAYLLDGVEVSPEIVVVHPPFAEVSGLRDVNSMGLALGVYRDSSGFVGVFTYDHTSGGYTDLGAPAGVSNFSPEAINDANEIAGTSIVNAASSNPINLAWRYTAAEGFVSLGVLDESVAEPESSVTAMNELGEIVGYSKVVLFKKGKNVTTGSHGFHYADGVMTDLGEGTPWGINNLGDIVVWDSYYDRGMRIIYGDSSVGEVDLYAVTVLPPDLENLTYVAPLREPHINDAGVVAGSSGSWTNGVPEEAFLLVPLP